MKRLLLAANVLVFALICCFVLSPLRVGTDSTRLFVMALPAACGGAYGVDQFPPFYPHLLCFLMKFGICNSVVLWGVNFLALGIGLVVLYEIMRLNETPYDEAMLTLLAVQLSWCVAKHCLLPQTDILLLPFFWGSILALMWFKRSCHRYAKIAYLAISFLLAAVALSIRIAAIPLFALIAVAISGVTAENMGKILRKKSFWLLSSLLVGVGAVCVVLAIRYTGFDDAGGYFRMFKRFISGEGRDGFWTVMVFHLEEIMQLTVNASAARLPTCITSVGVVVMPILVFAAIKRGFAWLDWYLMVILFAYGIEIFLWPCPDARFLLPIYPFAMMLIIHLIWLYKDKYWGVKVISTIYLSVFFLLGIASWGWLGRQWMFGKEFYRITEEPFLQRDYKNAYLRELNEIPKSGRTIPVFILKKFDARHTLCEDGKLRIEDYKAFQGRYNRGSMTLEEARKFILDEESISP